MEFVELGDGKRLVIPDVVIAASDKRDLVTQYTVAADDAGRAAIEGAARAKLDDEPEAPAAAGAIRKPPVVAGPAGIVIPSEAAGQPA